MIDARSFMEFCEKELHVKFIVAGTDKRALDVLAERDNELAVAQNADCNTGHPKEASMQLEICSFINTHTDWEEILAKDPYYIKTKRDSCFILLKYDQIRSNMSIPLVRECRGIILVESDNYLPVCIPFFKFGNFGESYVPDIDWKTARTQEKLDGSLIKLWHYKNKWHISSNGEIDARNAHISSALIKNAKPTNLFTLFNEAWSKTTKQIESLDPNYTYMFELTSPHNRVVVRYHETSVCHIGTRDNRTFAECDMDIGVRKPQEFALNTLEDCIENAKRLNYDNEGYVIVDRLFNRVKVKSPLYVALSHLSQGMTTHSNVLEIIKQNEQDEFLAYFPEFKEVFTDVMARIDEFAIKQTVLLEYINSMTFESRKALAEVVTKTECPACLFSLVDGKEPSARDWLMSRPSSKIIDYIGIKD